jgi:hypothetical protein
MYKFKVNLTKAAKVQNSFENKLAIVGVGVCLFFHFSEFVCCFFGNNNLSSNIRLKSTERISAPRYFF